MKPSDVIALCSAIVAAVGLLIAARSYWQNVKFNRQALMHSIGREYFSLRISAPDDRIDELVAFKYYACEEIYLWIRSERKRFFGLFNVGNKRTLDLDAWEWAVRSNINHNRSESINYLYRKRRIFDRDFVKFALNALKPETHRFVADVKVRPGTLPGDNKR